MQRTEKENVENEHLLDPEEDEDDNDDEDANDKHSGNHYERYPKCTSKIVLEEVTILATLLIMLWLDAKHHECVSENAKKTC